MLMEVQRDVAVIDASDVRSTDKLIVFGHYALADVCILHRPALNPEEYNQFFRVHNGEYCINRYPVHAESLWISVPAAADVPSLRLLMRGPLEEYMVT